MFSLLRQPRRTGARVAAKFYSDSCVTIRNTLIHTCTDRRKPKGKPATCPTAWFYLISHQWHHSYTVYFGLYVGLPPVAQADLDRLRRQTSHCEALFAYSTYPKYIYPIRQRAGPVQHVHNATVELLAVPGSAQSACNEGRIYTSVAHAQYD